MCFLTRLYGLGGKGLKGFPVFYHDVIVFVYTGETGGATPLTNMAAHALPVRPAMAGAAGTTSATKVAHIETKHISIATTVAVYVPGS